MQILRYIFERNQDTYLTPSHMVRLIGDFDEKPARLYTEIFYSLDLGHRYCGW